MNKSENKTFQKLQDKEKAALRGRFILLTACTRKEERCNI